MSAEDDLDRYLAWRSGTKKVPPLVEPRYEYKTHVVDCGYAIQPNGDIITSDGEPRQVDELMLKFAQEQAGKPLEFRFRKPRPEEVEHLRQAGIIP